MKVIKECLVFSILFLLFTVKASAAGLDEIHYIGNQLHLTSTKVDESSVGNQVPRAPMAPLTISIDGNTLYLYEQFTEMSLELSDESGVVFTDYIAGGAYNTSLPSDLKGTYELLMNDGEYIYTCTLVIE